MPCYKKLKTSMLNARSMSGILDTSDQHIVLAE